jgi:predicted DNA-binding ribbon-helix-helix protein
MLKKRSVVIAGHTTSLTLEDEFWEQLVLIARNRNLSINQLVAEIDRDRSGNLSSAIRVYILKSLL